jgi:hypothetical protein
MAKAVQTTLLRGAMLEQTVEHWERPLTSSITKTLAPKIPNVTLNDCITTPITKAADCRQYTLRRAKHRKHVFCIKIKLMYP